MTTSATTNVMILASAGTGKTFELSNRFIRLLIQGTHPANILATTFTRKAAGEILDRIVTRLAAAATCPKTARQTAIEMNEPGTTQEQFAGILESVIRNLNTLQVETLDAFFFKIARAFSLDIGMPPAWEVAENSEINRLSDRAIRRSLTARSTVSIVHDLAKGEAKRGISFMVRETVSDLYDIYRETHDQGRLEAWERLQSMPVLDDDTIDACVQQIAKLDYEATDSFRDKVQRDLAKVEQRDWNGVLRSGVISKVADGGTTFNRFEIPKPLLDLMLPLARHAVARNINLLVRQTRGAFEFLKHYHKHFRDQKHSNALLEFDDIAYQAALLFSRYSFGRLSWRLDQNIDHLLLDEFQDTSVQQWQVLFPLAKRVCQPGDDRSFFCVGDIKQAIYGWRGGVAEIFDEVREGFAEHLDDVASRYKSYRSSPAVIDTVNQIFQNLDQSRALGDQKAMYSSWLSRFRPHETEFDQLPGCATLEITQADETHDQDVAMRIKQLAEQFPGKSIGVLTRTNDNIAKIIFHLGNLGIRASEEGGNPLTDSAGVNLLLSAMQLIDHPDDTIARFHLLNSPLANRFQLTDANFQGPNHPCRSIAQEMRIRLLTDGYGELLAELAADLKPHCTTREWFRVGQLIEKGFTISAADHMRTRDLIQWVKTERVADPSTANINVMTIHKSKGLEFDIVVLPDLEFARGRDPKYIVGRESPTKPIDLVCRYMDESSRNWLPAEFQAAFDQQREREIHEYLCTIYVAVTRARNALHMLVRPSSHSGKKNAAGLIMSALNIDHHPGKTRRDGQVVWQHDFLDWSKHKASSEAPTAEEADPNSFVLERIRFAPASTNRNLPWESPSSREGGSTIRLGRLLQLEDNRDARMFGSLIHACFEQVHWLEDGMPDDKELLRILLRIEGASKAMVRSAIRSFRKMLRKPGTASLLSREQYQDDLFNAWDACHVKNERRFTVRLNDGVLNGSIDRLVLLQRDSRVVAADVVDFKTDELPPGDNEALQQRVAVYRPQIQSYRDAVAAIYGLPVADVSCRLMFVAIDQQVPVD